MNENEWDYKPVTVPAEDAPNVDDKADAPDPTGAVTEVENVEGPDLEAAWEAEQPDRDARDAGFEAILCAHHSAADHHISDRQHHGSWGPHHH
jgi:hypothetical protein